MQNALSICRTNGHVFVLIVILASAIFLNGCASMGAMMGVPYRKDNVDRFHKSAQQLHESFVNSKTDLRTIRKSLGLDLADNRLPPPARIVGYIRRVASVSRNLARLASSVKNLIDSGVKMVKQAPSLYAGPNVIHLPAKIVLLNKAVGWLKEVPSQAKALGAEVVSLGQCFAGLKSGTIGNSCTSSPAAVLLTAEPSNESGGGGNQRASVSCRNRCLKGFTCTRYGQCVNNTGKKTRTDPRAVLDAATKYEVPTYEVKTLNIYGNNFMSYVKPAGDENGLFTINLGSDFEKRFQNPTTEWEISNILNFDGSKIVSDDNQQVYHFKYELDGSLQGHYHKWLNGSRGSMLGIQLGLGFASYTNGAATVPSPTQPEDGADLMFKMAIGYGYGRVLDARMIAVAAAMYEAVGISATAIDLAKAAEIMGRYSAGAYDKKHKDSVVARAVYYADLAKHIGTVNPFKLYEVESSPIYNIGTRRSGAEFNLWLHLLSGDHGDDNDDGVSGKSIHLEQEGHLAVLVADNICFYLYEQFVYGLSSAEASRGQRVGWLTEDYDMHPGEDNLHLALEAGLSVDHSTQWNTNITINLNYGKLDSDIGPYAQDELSGYDYHIYFETTFAMATKLLGSVWIGMSGFSDPVNPIGAYSGSNLSQIRGLGYAAGEVGRGMGIRFRYYIF